MDEDRSLHPALTVIAALIILAVVFYAGRNISQQEREQLTEAAYQEGRRDTMQELQAYTESDLAVLSCYLGDDPDVARADAQAALAELAEAIKGE